ncbi:hypothetical protein J6590_078272 [Homalodisca vitripennis]|nr:hypothetical protein J6590_078272 [Homalodisca vitripennis]
MKKIKEIEEESDERNERVIDTIKVVADKHTKDIAGVYDELDRQKGEVKKLSQEVEEIKEKPSCCKRGELVVTCIGGENMENTVPKFNGQHKNPKEFITKLGNYVKRLQDRKGNSPCISFKEIVDYAMEGNESRWWQVIKDDVNNIEELEYELLEKFWNRDIQNGIRRRMNNEKYRPGGNLSRSEYFR